MYDVQFNMRRTKHEQLHDKKNLDQLLSLKSDSLTIFNDDALEYIISSI